MKDIRINEIDYTTTKESKCNLCGKILVKEVNPTKISLVKEFKDRGLFQICVPCWHTNYKRGLMTHYMKNKFQIIEYFDAQQKGDTDSYWRKRGLLKSLRSKITSLFKRG